VGFDPLPAIGISSKKSCDEPNNDSPNSSLAHLLGIGHWALVLSEAEVLGIGHWALGIGHWALGIGHWALGTCTERTPSGILLRVASPKAYGIASLRAQPKKRRVVLGRGEKLTATSPLLPHLPHLLFYPSRIFGTIVPLSTTAGTDTCVLSFLVCSIIWSMSSWEKRWT
jgi:hypothetical protein